jgi:serine/threonine protein kinase
MSDVNQRASLEPQSMVASYRVSHSLASGGMAEVFEAEHAVLPRRVALKVMHPELLRKPDMDTRFMREACILESFTHPGGVRVFECGVLPDGRPWMAMELVRGHAMSRDMSEPMNPVQVVSILASVMEVLAAAHAVGLIHRDLKPDNLLLADDPEDYPVRVIDWGLARLNTFKRLTQDGTAAGTPLYMSPEQTQGKALDGRCDVYSLGVVAYEALAGFPPFDGQNLVEIVVRQVTTEPTPLHQLRPDIPREVSDLVTLMLTRDPAQRPTAAEMIPRLAQLLEMMGPRPAMSEAEDPILEYSFDQHGDAESLASADETMRALEEATMVTGAPDDLELEIDVEMSDVSDAESVKTWQQGMPKVVVEMNALEVSARAAMEAVAQVEAAAAPRLPLPSEPTSVLRPSLVPMNEQSDTVVLDHPIFAAAAAAADRAAALAAGTPAPTSSSRITPAPVRVAPRHPPSEPIVLEQKIDRALQAAHNARTPSEPLRVRPAATPQHEPSVLVTSAREEAGPQNRMHWTPEPVRLETLGITGARKRRRCEITPRGPSDQVAGELHVSIGSRRN